jgi:hypothetical protein
MSYIPKVEGEVVYHKATGKKVVVIGFDEKSKLPQCRSWNEVAKKYRTSYIRPDHLADREDDKSDVYIHKASGIRMLFTEENRDDPKIRYRWLMEYADPNTGDLTLETFTKYEFTPA